MICKVRFICHSVKAAHLFVLLLSSLFTVQKLSGSCFMVFGVLVHINDND